MGATTKFFIKCLKYAFDGKSIEEIPNNVNYNELLSLSVRHGVTAMVYYALNKTSSSLDAGFYKKLSGYYFTQLSIEADSEHYKELIKQKLEENQIEFMFLKGYYLKKMYLTPEMRYASDVDVLINPKKIKLAKKVFLDLDFKQKKDDEHHLVLLSPSRKTIFELHKKIFVGDFEKYFKTGFEKGVKEEGFNYSYNLTPSDFYISVLVHYAYHFITAAGVGVRALLDIRAMRKFFKDQLDDSYIDGELEKIGLKTFKIQFEKAQNYLFSGEQEDEYVVKLCKYIINSSLLNNNENLATSQIENTQEDIKTSKAKAVLKKIFPNKEVIYYNFNFIKKFKIFLPLGYVLRWFKVLFTRPKNLKQLKDIAKVENEALNEFLYVKNGLEIEK